LPRPHRNRNVQDTWQAFGRLHTSDAPDQSSWKWHKEHGHTLPLLRLDHQERRTGRQMVGAGFNRIKAKDSRDDSSVYSHSGRPPRQLYDVGRSTRIHNQVSMDEAVREAHGLDGHLESQSDCLDQALAAAIQGNVPHVRSVLAGSYQFLPDEKRMEGA